MLTTVTILSKTLVEKIWLSYYNRVLYEQGLIDEREYHRMEQQISVRKDKH